MKTSGIMALLFWVLTLNSTALADKLVWDPSSGAVDGYKVYYGEHPGNYPNCLHAGTSCEYSLDNLPLAEGQEYYFVVTAYNTTDESAYSDYIAWTPPDKTPPAPPHGLAAE